MNWMLSIMRDYLRGHKTLSCAITVFKTTGKRVDDQSDGENRNRYYWCIITIVGSKSYIRKDWFILFNLRDSFFLFACV